MSLSRCVSSVQVLSASQIRTMFSEVEAIAMMHETQLLPQLKQKITVRANADSRVCPFGISGSQAAASLPVL